MPSEHMNDSGQPGKPDRMWPFGVHAAFLAASIILVALIVIVTVSEHFSGWPPTQSGGAVFGGVLLLSLLPIGLMVIDVVASRGGSVGYGPLKIEFLQVLAPTSADISLPSNIALPGIPVIDSSSGEISKVLADAARNEVAVVDLEGGDAWWPTRLFVLAAGAKRIGQPAAIVFVATEGRVPGVFQGWVRPVDLVEELMRWKPEFREHYVTAQVVASQLRVVQPPAPGGAVIAPAPGGAVIAPAPGGAVIVPVPGGAVMVPAGFALAEKYAPVVYQPGVTELSPLLEEQVLSVQLGQLEPPQPSETITAVKLKEVFTSVLFTGAINLEEPTDKQLDIFVKQTAPYTAVISSGRYEGLMPSTAGQRAILEGLLKQRSPSQQS
jgi:hypothetical protein